MKMAGLNADRLALSLTNIAQYATFQETDTGNLYLFNGLCWIWVNTLPANNEGQFATYSAAIEITSFAANATDIFRIFGSATKTIKVSRVQLTADATNAGIVDIYLYKRTTANVGGTPATVNGIQHDSLDPAYTATVQTYSANPTALGLGQILRTDGVALPGSTTTGYPFTPLIWDFGAPRNTKMPTLRGNAESLALNFGGQAIPTGLGIWVDVEWTES